MKAAVANGDTVRGGKTSVPSMREREKGEAGESAETVNETAKAAQTIDRTNRIRTVVGSAQNEQASQGNSFRNVTSIGTLEKFSIICHVRLASANSICFDRLQATLPTQTQRGFYYAQTSSRFDPGAKEACQRKAKTDGFHTPTSAGSISKTSTATKTRCGARARNHP
jgi:hypothetical protein